MKLVGKILTVGLTLTMLAAMLCIGLTAAADPVYTMRENNNGDTLSAKWTASTTAKATLDESNKLNAGNAAQLAFDSSSNEYGVAQQNYETYTEGVEADGIRFRAVADKAIKVRVAYWIFDKDVQYYWDVDFDTTPRVYTLNLADAASHTNPKPAYDGAHKLGGLILQYGIYGGDKQATLWFDELETFVGDAATGSEVITVTQPTEPTEPTEPKPVEPTPAEIFEKSKKTTLNDFSKPDDVIFEWMNLNVPDDGSLTITAEDGSITATFDRSKNKYGIASAAYNPGIKFKENHDGIAFTASAESPCVVRVAFVIDNYQQLYADVELTTEPQQFVLFFKDMKGYDGYTKPDDLTGLMLHQMIFQIGRGDTTPVNQGPNSNVLHLTDAITLFTVSNGETPENPGDNKPDDNKPNVPAGEAIPYAVAAVAVLSAAALAYVSRKQK